MKSQKNNLNCYLSLLSVWILMSPTLMAKTIAIRVGIETELTTNGHFTKLDTGERGDYVEIIRETDQLNNAGDGEDDMRTYLIKGKKTGSLIFFEVHPGGVKERHLLRIVSFDPKAEDATQPFNLMRISDHGKKIKLFVKGNEYNQIEFGGSKWKTDGQIYFDSGVKTPDYGDYTIEGHIEFTETQLESDRRLSEIMRRRSTPPRELRVVVENDVVTNPDRRPVVFNIKNPIVTKAHMIEDGERIIGREDLGYD